jgi:hypothetical protein
LKKFNELAWSDAEGAKEGNSKSCPPVCLSPRNALGAKAQSAPRPVRVRPEIAFQATTAITAPMTATTIVVTLIPVM